MPNSPPGQDPGLTTVLERAVESPAASSAQPVLSAEVHEFMARAPHWLVRSGTMVLASVLGIILLLSVVIKYPDTITERVTVVGTQPVLEVVARQSGHLESLRVTQGQKVEKGEILAVLESPSRAEVVLTLGARINRLLSSVIGKTTMPDESFKPEEGLGKIQESYAEFLNSYNQLRSRLADDYAEKAGALLRDQIAGKRKQIESLRQQSALSRRGADLAREKFDRMKQLRDKATISASDIADQELAMLQEMRADTTAQRAQTEAEIEAAKLEKELHLIEHDREESLRTARELLRSNLNKLRGEIDVWEIDYVLRAPADGVIAFYDFWSDQQFVAAGRQVFLIVPETTRLVGRMPVRQGGAGKIKPGQMVRVRFDDFPYKEFGIVTGSVQSISMVARDGANLVLVDLPYPLVTSFKKTVPFKQDMTGQASIVTEDIRLLGRIFYEIRRAFVNNTGN
jgi:multidrug resistance efflux pump